jgi:hypothetical protein
MAGLSSIHWWCRFSSVVVGTVNNDWRECRVVYNELTIKGVEQMAYSNDTIQKVWEKGTLVSANDPNVWRKDQCKAWIGGPHYGNRQSQYGWEIDHIKPESEGGGDELSNLCPLQWENNASKQAGRLSCVVTSSHDKNVPVK